MYNLALRQPAQKFHFFMHVSDLMQILIQDISHLLTENKFNMFKLCFVVSGERSPSSTACNIQNTYYTIWHPSDGGPFQIITSQF